MRSRPRIRAVLLDAYGTLVELDDPVERLARGLAEAGHPHPRRAVAKAFRAEVGFYRANHDLGRDAAGLAALRLAAAAAFAEALPSGPPPKLAAEILASGLRYRLFPDTIPSLDALAARGCRLGVVSNWDASLPDVLEAVGIRDRFDAVTVSAVAGARKPHAAVFEAALEALGAEPAEALHAGDSYELDCLGAAAAGIRAVLLDRTGHAVDRDCERIPTLAALPGLVGAA